MKKSESFLKARTSIDFSKPGALWMAVYSHDLFSEKDVRTYGEIVAIESILDFIEENDLNESFFELIKELKNKLIEL